MSNAEQWESEGGGLILASKVWIRFSITFVLQTTRHTLLFVKHFQQSAYQGH